MVMILYPESGFYSLAAEENNMKEVAIQDFYPDEEALCYGCGKNNPDGLHIRTIWNGEEGVFHFRPRPCHTAFPGVVYGGLLACLIDCNSIGTATAAAYGAEGRQPGTEPPISFVTANLNVTYLKPTPLEAELVVRARVKEMGERKVVISTSIYVDDVECVRAEVVTVRASRAGIPGKK